MAAPGSGHWHDDLRDRAGQLLRTLAATHAEGHDSRVFVLGGRHEQRLNLPAQQSRALNLVWALKKRKRLGPEAAEQPRVIVIGAGVAGATFAAAAAREGADVLMIDEHEEPITVQRAATQRYLHPCLFDWPHAGYDQPTADTPVLNWREGSAADVRNQLVAGLVLAVHPLGDSALMWLAQCAALTVDQSKKRPEVVVAAIDEVQASVPLDLTEIPATRLAADVVVLASGFAPERRVPGAVSGSYWKDDRLGELRRKVLIIGDGDGALTELFRVAIKGAQNPWLWQQSLLPEIVAGATDRLRDEVRVLDEKIRNDRRASSYEGLTDKSLNGVDGALGGRSGRQVTLVASEPVLAANSFLINRFVAARLAANGYLTVLTGRVDPTDAPTLAQAWDVIWRTGPPEGRKLVAPFFSLQAITEALGHSALQARRAGLAADVLDETRTAWWFGRLDPATLRSGLDVMGELDRLHVRLPSRTTRPRQRPVGWPTRRTITAAQRLKSFIAGNADAADPLLPDHIRRIWRTAGQLVWLATFFGADPWWLDRREPAPRLSLDILAIASDLPPFQVATAIASNPGHGLELVKLTPEFTSQARVWVALDGLQRPHAESPGELADTAAVMKTPPTWGGFDGDPGAEGSAPVLGSKPAQAASDALGLRVDALMRQIGALAALEVAEGLTRSWPPPRWLLLELLRALADPRMLDPEATSEPTFEQRRAALAVDLFTRAVASVDPRIVRPGLVLFGQFIGLAGEDPTLTDWTQTTLISTETRPKREQVGRSLMAAAFTRLAPVSAAPAPGGERGGSSMELSYEDLETIVRLAEPDRFGADIIARAKRLMSAAEPLAGTASIWAEEPPIGLDLSYAGVIVVGPQV